MMKRSSRQFGDQLSGFGRQSEKFRRIGVCIRRNFTPWKGIFSETAEGTDQSKPHVGVFTYVTNPLKVKCYCKCNLIQTFSEKYLTNINRVYLNQSTIWKSIARAPN